MKLLRVFFLISIFLAGNLLAQNNSRVKLAENLIRGGNYSDALSLLEPLFLNGNYSVNVANGLNKCYEELGLYDSWIEFLNKLIQIKPGAFNHQVDLGKAYYYKKDFEKAYSIWRDVYIFDPPTLMRYRLVAQAMISFRLFDDAIAVYQQALSKLKNHQNLYLEIANLYKVQLNYEKAVENYVTYYQHYEKQIGYVQSMLLQMAQDSESAQRIITSLEKNNPGNNPELNAILANLHINRKNYPAAFQIYKDIEKEDPSATFRYIQRFAREAEKDHNYEYAIKAYNYILEKPIDQKQELLIKFKLAQAIYFLISDADQEKPTVYSIETVLELLNELIEKSHAHRNISKELLADIYAEYFNDLDRALNYYKSINVNALSVRERDKIRFKIADIYIKKNQLNLAEKVFSEIESENLKNRKSYELAELKYYAGHLNQATNQYQALLNQLQLRDSLSNNVLDRLFELRNFREDSLGLKKLAEARLYVRQNKLSQAADEFEELFQTGKQLGLMSAIEAAYIYLKLDKKDEAERILNELINSDSSFEQRDEALFLLAGMYEKNNPGRAFTLYQQIMMEYPSSFYNEQARQRARDLSIINNQNLNN